MEQSSEIISKYFSVSMDMSTCQSFSSQQFLIIWRWCYCDICACVIITIICNSLLLLYFFIHHFTCSIIYTQKVSIGYTSNNMKSLFTWNCSTQSHHSQLYQNSSRKHSTHCELHSSLRNWILHQRVLWTIAEMLQLHQMTSVHNIFLACHMMLLHLLLIC